MAWRPFGARPLSDIICITKSSDKTCLVTEILSVSSNEGLKPLIQLLYIITIIIKKLWALVRLSFTQICIASAKQHDVTYCLPFILLCDWRHMIDCTSTRGSTLGEICIHLGCMCVRKPQSCFANIQNLRPQKVFRNILRHCISIQTSDFD